MHVSAMKAKLRFLGPEYFDICLIKTKLSDPFPDYDPMCTCTTTMGCKAPAVSYRKTGIHDDQIDEEVPKIHCP